MLWSLPKGRACHPAPPPSALLTRTCGQAELVPVPWELGTEVGLRALPVLLLPGHSNIQQIQSRNTLKDAIIIIQSILLVVFISVPMLLFLDKVSDSISSPSSNVSPGTSLGCPQGQDAARDGYGQALGLGLLHTGNKHLKWGGGDCLDLHLEAAGPGLGGRGWDRGQRIPVGAGDTQPVTLLSTG